MKDPHTDYDKSWIEEAIYFAVKCFHEGLSDHDVAVRLHEYCDTSADSDEYIDLSILPLILIGGKTLYQDEIGE